MCSIIWLYHAYDVVVYVNISTLHGTPLSQFCSRVYFYDVNLIYQHSISYKSPKNVPLETLGVLLSK
jgi:hypothetical protein